MEHEVDNWISQLSQCKQLSEADVKKLCDKVRNNPPSIGEPDNTPPHPHLATLAAYSCSLPEYARWIDEGDFDGGVQRAAGALPGHGLWGYPWSIRACLSLSSIFF